MIVQQYSRNERIESLDYPELKENKLACFVNSYGSFQAFNLVHDFWRKYRKVYVS